MKYARTYHRGFVAPVLTANIYWLKELANQETKEEKVSDFQSK